MSVPTSSSLESEKDAEASVSTSQGAALLRVSATKVSRLMDLVGELSLSVSETIRSSDLDGLELTEFEKSAHRLMMVVREVQDAAAELRLVPVGEVFRRMRRMVRELERATNKEIDLVLEGEDVEIDKVVADRLYEPLVHVLRNSADHGLESPTDRKMIGKLRKGRIALSAAQIGGDIQITVADDGRGLDRDRILARARERGLVGSEEEPEDHVLWKVIFQPGFSTAEAVTNLSGRGVGMDVLNSTMKELRGRISIDSERGRGSKIVLAIPLTLAFIESLVMRVGTRLYATPIDVVAEMFQPGTEQISRVSAEDGKEMVQVRGAFIPICRLQHYYGEETSDLPPLEKLIIVVFNTSTGRIGLPVDEMFDQQQVVMKPLQGQLEKIRASFGCGLLASGDVAIVLDCERLAESARS